MTCRGNPLEGNTRFVKLQELGSGTFGFVLLAHDKVADEKVAIKFMPRGVSITQNVEREIMNHRKLIHQHVIGFKGVFLTDAYLGIILEYAPGGDLLDWIKTREGISERQARWLFQQLIMGLDYIHMQGVVNRDIKLENSLVTEGDMPMLKLCDFGYSKNVQLSAAKSIVGTRSYLAPEVIGSSRGEKYDGIRADIWSTGVFLYIMLLGMPPFEKPDANGKDASMEEVIRRIDNVEFEIPSGALSAECEDMIRSILVRDPAKRPSLQQIQMHKWYQTALPEGVLEYNKEMMEISLDESESGVQKESEIRAILQTAASISTD